ncbi:MAG: SPOR domain-containing protein [Vicinamibacterales bacterium]
MSELTHDAEDGFHEIQLSGKQVVFLFMAGTLVSVMIFLCGVLVGRGVRASRGEDVDPPIADASPLPGGTQAQGTATAEARPSVDPPAPPPGAELTYEKDLASKDKAKDTLKPATETQKPAPAAAEPEPAAPPAKAAAPPATTAPPAQSPPGAYVPTSGRPGTWVLQVSALQNRAAAGAIVRRLISKGYPAFLSASAPGTTQIFRVQIGKYADRREAEQIARRLEKEEQFKPDIKR